MNFRAKAVLPDTPCRGPWCFAGRESDRYDVHKPFPGDKQMLRWLTAIGTALSLFALFASGSKTRSPANPAGLSGWPLAVKATNQFDNWT